MSGAVCETHKLDATQCGQLREALAAQRPVFFAGCRRAAVPCGAEEAGYLGVVVVFIRWRYGVVALLGRVRQSVLGDVLRLPVCRVGEIPREPPDGGASTGPRLHTAPLKTQMYRAGRPRLHPIAKLLLERQCQRRAWAASTTAGATATAPACSGSRTEPRTAAHHRWAAAAH